MTMFDAQAEVAAAEGKYPPFTFRGLDGETYTLPHPMTLSERHGELIAAGEVKTVIREFAGEAAAAAVEQLPIFVSTKLVKAWLDQMDGDDEGKAPSPSSENPSGAAPSPVTSPSEG